MHVLYVLKSQKDEKKYIGITSKDPRIRTKEHNSNKGKFTRGHQPWKLAYKEYFVNKKSAMSREKYLKSGKGREWLDKEINK